MEEIIDVVLDNIYSAYLERDRTDPSLLQGEAGFCLFNKAYLEYKNEKDWTIFQHDIQLLAESAPLWHSPTYCGGKSGVNWLYSYLKNTAILDTDDWDMITADDPELAGQALILLRQQQFDFLHGAIGIAYQLLYSRGNDPVYKGFFLNILLSLRAAMYLRGDKIYIPDYDRFANKLNPEKANLGLAHGLPSILKFCLQCCKRGIETEIAKGLALQLIAFIRKSENDPSSVSRFPSAVTFDRVSSAYSRLGWCYGDLGIGIILYQAGLHFQDTELCTYSCRLLLETTQRKKKDETTVLDAGLCHGAAGIAHIYNRMWRYTGLIEFRKAADYWLAKTLDMGNYPGGPAGYKYFNGSSSTYENSYCLLDGPAGIGLALISHMTGDFSWDYCLMLND